MESVIDAQVPGSVPALRVIPEQTRLGATTWMDCCPPLSATLVLAQSWCDYTSHVISCILIWRNVLVVPVPPICSTEAPAGLFIGLSIDKKSRV